MPRNFGGGIAKPVQAHTTNYTCTVQDCGKVFTNQGAAGTITFTLPVSGPELNGWRVEFITIESQSIAIASAPADSLVVLGDATADTITTDATVGLHIEIVCTGQQMFVIDSTAATTTTAVRRLVLVS